MTRRPALALLVSILGLAPLVGCEMFSRDKYAANEPATPPMSGRPASGLATTPPVDIVGVNEADIVEALAMHRQSYRQHLIALHAYYLNYGNTEKARQAERELRDLKKVKQYRFMVAAEVPHYQLKPSQSIAAADALYEDGLHYYETGGHGIPLLFSENKMKLALEKFQTIIREYPTSDKIDDAAFYCGEIHKEYFNDNNTAVRYYEKAIEWNPSTPHGARFQAAVVLDYRLHDRDRAIELYQEVIEKEAFKKTNVVFARRRIGQLLNPTRRGSVAPTLSEPASDGSPIPASATESTLPTSGTPLPTEEGRP